MKIKTFALLSFLVFAELGLFANNAQAFDTLLGKGFWRNPKGNISKLVGYITDPVAASKLLTEKDNVRVGFIEEMQGLNTWLKEMFKNATSVFGISDISGFSPGMKVQALAADYDYQQEFSARLSDAMQSEKLGLYLERHPEITARLMQKALTCANLPSQGHHCALQDDYMDLY